MYKKYKSDEPQLIWSCNKVADSSDGIMATLAASKDEFIATDQSSPQDYGTLLDEPFPGGQCYAV
jgi:hypothetical protein